MDGWLVPSAAYVHVPFCRTKCLYCDFNTYAGKDRLIPEYVAAVATEIGRRAQTGRRLTSVYFGGGTPSLLTLAQLRRVLEALRRTCGVAGDAEITLEANPGTFGPSYVEGLRALGVNRLSLGVQSLDDETLRRLARTHSAAQALDAVRTARVTGMRSVNLDLIYGLPWQTLESWRDGLRRALDTAPDHISLYALMVEEGTPLATLVDRGKWEVADQDLVADMYEAALPELRGAGFRHYEVSNWARAGHESRHNLVYWRNEAYLGFGAGAHAYAGGTRSWNVRPIEHYVRRVASGADPTEGCETLDAAGQVGETAALALRLPLEGIEFARFRRRFGVEPRQRWAAELGELSAAGLVAVDAERARITERALLVSSEIAARFVA
ncbi:MAG TPA: radical SAM family heme chaperone HemW [Chloroflexota bacterium]|nr:radical SAM family heme chaperone HemW [Chloroflexota bacterium]